MRIEVRFELVLMFVFKIKLYLIISVLVKINLFYFSFFLDFLGVNWLKDFFCFLRKVL